MIFTVVPASAFRLRSHETRVSSMDKVLTLCDGLEEEQHSGCPAVGEKRNTPDVGFFADSASVVILA